MNKNGNVVGDLSIVYRRIFPLFTQKTAEKPNALFWIYCPSSGEMQNFLLQNRPPPGPTLISSSDPDREHRNQTKPKKTTQRIKQKFACIFTNTFVTVLMASFRKFIELLWIFQHRKLLIDQKLWNIGIIFCTQTGREELLFPNWKQSVVRSTEVPFGLFSFENAIGAKGCPLRPEYIRLPMRDLIWYSMDVRVFPNVTYMCVFQRYSKCQTHSYLWYF